MSTNIGTSENSSARASATATSSRIDAASSPRLHGLADEEPELERRADDVRHRGRRLDVDRRSHLLGHVLDRGGVAAGPGEQEVGAQALDRSRVDEAARPGDRSRAGRLRQVGPGRHADEAIARPQRRDELGGTRLERHDPLGPALERHLFAVGSPNGDRVGREALAGRLGTLPARGREEEQAGEEGARGARAPVSGIGAGNPRLSENGLPWTSSGSSSRSRAR